MSPTPTQQAAVERLRQLMDQDPRAQRPRRTQPPAPPMSESEFRRHAEEVALAETLTIEDRAAGIRYSLAPDYYDEEHLINGHQRALLARWLPTVTECCNEDRLAALDDITPRHATADAHRVLTEEGFTIPVATYPEGTGDDILVVLAHPDGLLAVYWTYQQKVEQVAVYCNVTSIDHDMFNAGIPDTMFTVRDDRDRLTRTKAAELTSHGSLRTKLAVIRAFGTLVTPWRSSPLPSWLGRESALGRHVAGSAKPSDQQMKSVIAAATMETRIRTETWPDHVHQLLGAALRQCRW